MHLILPALTFLSYLVMGTPCPPYLMQLGSISPFRPFFFQIIFFQVFKWWDACCISFFHSFSFVVCKACTKNNQTCSVVMKYLPLMTLLLVVAFFVPEVLLHAWVVIGLLGKSLPLSLSFSLLPSLFLSLLLHPLTPLFLQDYHCSCCLLLSAPQST